MPLPVCLGVVNISVLHTLALKPAKAFEAVANIKRIAVSRRCVTSSLFVDIDVNYAAACTPLNFSHSLKQY